MADTSTFDDIVMKGKLDHHAYKDEDFLAAKRLIHAQGQRKPYSSDWSDETIRAELDPVFRFQHEQGSANEYADPVLRVFEYLCEGQKRPVGLLAAHDLESKVALENPDLGETFPHAEHAFYVRHCISHPKTPDVLFTMLKYAELYAAQNKYVTVVFGIHQEHAEALTPAMKASGYVPWGDVDAKTQKQYFSKHVDESHKEGVPTPPITKALPEAQKLEDVLPVSAIPTIVRPASDVLPQVIPSPLEQSAPGTPTGIPTPPTKIINEFFKD